MQSSGAGQVWDPQLWFKDHIPLSTYLAQQQSNSSLCSSKRHGKLTSAVICCDYSAADPKASKWKAAEHLHNTAEVSWQNSHRGVVDTQQHSILLLKSNNFSVSKCCIIFLFNIKQERCEVSNLHVTDEITWVINWFPLANETNRNVNAAQEPDTASPSPLAIACTTQSSKWACFLWSPNFRRLLL